MKRPALVPTEEVSMREFRAAPAKILRRAARAGTRLRIGTFVLAVEEAKTPKQSPTLHGAMAGTGEIVGDPSGILSANDPWDADG